LWAPVGPALGGCDGAADAAELGATEGDALRACDGNTQLIDSCI